MPEPIDRRSFLARGLVGVAGAALVVVAGPEFLATAGATPTAIGPNLVFDPSFEKDIVGSSPRGWVIS